MTHTTARSLFFAALIGAAVLWGVEWLLVSRGEPVLVPPATWSIALVLLGGVMVALAWPIRVHIRLAQAKTLLDPFYATRIVLLAQSMAIGGAALSGGAGGVFVFLATRPIPSSTGLWLSGVAVFAAIVLMAGGLIAQRWCTLPPGSSGGEGVEEPEGEAG